MFQPSSKLPWTCSGHSLRGPAHDPKEEEVTGHPLRSASVGGPAGSRTIVPSISDTRKDVNGGFILLLHDPNRILTKEEYVNHSYSLTKSEFTDAKLDTGYYLRTIFILIVLGMCLVDFRSTSFIQKSEIRLLTLVELSLSCRCANT